MFLLYYLFREDSSELLYFVKILLKVFNKFTDVFTCKSRNFQKYFENELFFYNTIIKFAIPLTKIYFEVKNKSENESPDFISHQKQWI